MAGPSQVTSLDSLVRHLSADAADVLVAALLPKLDRPCGGALGGVRLASKSLRRFVDGSLRRLFLRVESGSNRWEVPRLERWGRVDSLELLLEPHGPAVRNGDGPIMHNIGAELDTLALLAVTAQSPAMRQRITSLAVRWDDDFIHARVDPGHDDPNALPSISPLTVSHLALLFPSLRELNLDVVISTLDRKSELHLPMMYDALAAQPYLDTLRLPTWGALSGIGALATSLKRLRISAPYFLTVEVPYEQLSVISQLRALKELQVDAAHMTLDTLTSLLNALPDGRPELSATLDLTPYGVLEQPGAVYGTGRWVCTCSGGAIRELECSGVELAHLASVCAGLAPYVSVLRVVEVRPGQDPLPPAQLGPFRAFVKRCGGGVRLVSLDLPQKATLAPAQQAVEVLGVPQMLHWTAVGGRDQLSLPAPKHTDAPVAAAAAAAEAEAAPPGRVAQPAAAGAQPGAPQADGEGSRAGAFPHPAEVLQRAVDGLAAAAAGGRAEAGASDGAQSSPVVLACGPFVGTLAFTPKVVKSWLKHLSRAAQWQAQTPVFAFQLLPSAEALLVRCPGPEAAAALVAGAAQAQVGRAAPSGLAAYHVGRVPAWRDVAFVLAPYMKQAMQQALDACGTHDPLACLAFVVRVAKFLDDLPSESRS